MKKLLLSSLFILLLNTGVYANFVEPTSNQTLDTIAYFVGVTSLICLFILSPILETILIDKFIKKEESTEDENVTDVNNIKTSKPLAFVFGLNNLFNIIISLFIILILKIQFWWFFAVFFAIYSFMFYPSERIVLRSMYFSSDKLYLKRALIKLIAIVIAIIFCAILLNIWRLAVKWSILS